MKEQTEKDLKRRIGRVAALEMPATRKSVLVFLEWYDWKRSPIPTASTLARQTCLSLRTVRRSLKDLKQSGLITDDWRLTA